MQNKKRAPKAFKWHGIILLEVLAGVVMLAVMFVLASNADISAAEAKLTTTVEYMKEQCNSSQMQDLASAAKSQLRVAESVEQIRWRLQHGTDEEYSTDTLAGWLCWMKAAQCWRSMTQTAAMPGSLSRRWTRTPCWTRRTFMRKSMRCG